VHGVAILIGIHGDSARPNLDGRAKRPNRNFPAVRDENLFKQYVPSVVANIRAVKGYP
jgi:hypothetical protein